MASKRKQTRVSKPRGLYNQYLRENDPLEHIPESSKRQLLSDTLHYETTKHRNESTSFVEYSKNPQETENYVDRRQYIRLPTTDYQLSPSDDIDNEKDNEIETSTAQLSVSDVSDANIDMQQQLYEMSHDTVLPDNPNYPEIMEDIEADATSTLNKTEATKKIYESSNISLGASMLLIMTFAVKNSLTGEGLNDLLKLIEMHCPPVNLIPQTLGKFKKWFQDVRHPLCIHKFCSKCKNLLNDEQIRAGECENTFCKNILGIDNGISHFIEIPIKEQVKSLMLHQGFYKDLQHRFSRVKQDPHAYEDIYDGEVYMKLSSPGKFLSDPNNISLLWNTDGIPCFKSSKMSLWPLFFQINELPFRKRTSTDNMILGGLWFGESKPAIMSFTRPFIDRLQELEKDGVKVTSPEKGTFRCRVAVIGGTADLPARSLACNTIQFNGKHGCCKCLQPGETFKIGVRGHCHIFPFQKENPTGPPRTESNFLKDVETAISTGVISHGIKGPSFLQCLTHYNLVSSTCIDYMHGILLGVTKLLMKLWFSSDHSNEAFSISTFTEIVDRRLSNIKPPNNISRCPRSIKEHLSYWKATELRSWLLYYSLPLLKDIHTTDIYQHYILLVESVYLLLQDSITNDDINKAESMLIHFCCMFGAYYGARFMTCNLHQLLHLPEMVRSMGPLWAYSCFSFENANGTLLKLYHGTQNVDLQIAQSVAIIQRLPELYADCLDSDTSEMELYKSMQGISVNRNEKCLMHNVYSIGAGKNRKLQQFQMQKLTEFLGFLPTKYTSFDRLRIGRDVFHSRTYRRSHARNSYTISFKIEAAAIGIGQVEFYLQIQTGDRCINVAIVSPMDFDVSDSDCNTSTLACDSLTSATVGHIHVLKNPVPYNVIVVPVKCILRKCVFIDVFDRPDNVVFACSLVNTKEQG